MPGLPAVGTLSYNGYTFDGTAKIKVAAHKLRDEAERTVIGVRYEITVEAIISGGGSNTSDANMAAIHSALSQDGQALVFANKGFGASVAVNGASAFRDIAWGPKTEVLYWEPIGGSQACSIVWTVTTTIPECTFANTSGIMAMNYEVDYQQDIHGDTTRTISGYLQIAQTRTVAKTIPDVADRYRVNIAPQAPLGYERTQDWKTSKDKSRLDFTIVDTQIPSPNPYPENVTAISGRHGVGWSRGNRGAMKHRNVLQMSVRPQRGISGAQAFLIFNTIVNQRTQAAKYAGRSVFLDELYVEEDIFGFPCEFRAGWRVIGKLKDIITDNGLWKPIGTDWQLWAASLTGSQFHIRGTSGLKLEPNNDAIVDLCGYTGTSNNDGGQVFQQPEPPNAAPLRNEYPTPSDSWLYYRAQLIPITSTPLVRHSILQAAPTDNAPNDPNATGGFSLPYSGSATSDVIQKRGKDKITVRFVGQARRAGFKIPRPKLQSIGGRPATEKHGIFSMRKIGDYLGVPVYAAQWDITYVIDNAPAGEIAPPDNVEEPDN